MGRMLTALLLAASLAACGPARRGEPLMGPFAGLSADAQAGERHFMALCNQCHPVGEAGIGPALNDKPLPGWAIRTQVRWGIGAMPAFSEQALPSQHLDQIVAYLKYLRSRG